MPAGRPRSLDIEQAMPVIVRHFWRAGYAGMTLDDLAAELGVSKPTLYRSLGEKDALFVAALEHYHRSYLRPGEEHVETAPTFTDALRGYLSIGLERMVDDAFPAGCFLTDTITCGAFTSGPVATTLTRLQQRSAMVLHRRAEQAIADGELAATATAPVVVRYAMGQFAVLSMVSRSAPDRSDLDELVDVMVGGLPWAATDGADRTGGGVSRRGEGRG
ncbi:MAG: TetR/AcrR family transcriptional regulator [Actinomycetota bacterium]